ncbi:hypothetical protein GIB67_009441 [Kingdonia uniflora]|uniref:Uncharacterized protein n=1 Tax=Kingdonia uniflora TaxID=39325 RepID=A0A7J7N3F6_9MAGN|nr:hypothetical protein GIB67_009441 [Kingdonia uniflora]
MNTIRPLVEKIQKRANSWTGKLLSFQGRVILARAILNSLPIYNMVIYKWPRLLIKEGYSIIRNFIWTGDPSQRKGITVKWEKVCKSLKEGGLGIRSLKEVNDDMLCKLHWAFCDRQEDWSQFMHTNFTNIAGDFIRYHKKSTIWPGINLAASINRPYIRWLVGNGANIDFWRDTWATEIPLREYNEIPQSLWKRCIAQLSDFINSNGWDIPTDIRILLLALAINVLEIPCNPQEADKRIWKPDSYGNFTVINAYETIRKKSNTAWWWKYT